MLRALRCMQMEMDTQPPADMEMEEFFEAMEVDERRAADDVDMELLEDEDVEMEEWE